MSLNREVVVCSVLGAVGLTATAAGLCLLTRKVYKKSSTNPYEEKKIVDEYMGFHYCPADEYLQYKFGPVDACDFPKRCAELCLKHKQEGVLSRAFDIGCAVGRSTFELARVYDEVLGMDFSQAFIARCQELKMTGLANYSMVVEGELVENKTATIDRDIDRTRVSFTVGDACNLPKVGQFGCVFAGNLICRLPDPMKFYSRLPELVVPGGILVITSPYTWLEHYTPKSKWIGGYVEDGHEVRGFESLKQILAPHFEFIEEQNMPFLIRETVRKNQWTVAHATVWKRTSV